MLLAGLGSADPYGCSSLPAGNLKYEACIQLGAPFGPALADGTNVSGTEVNLTFGGTVSRASTASEPWKAGELIKIHARMGDEPTKVWNVQNGWVGGWESGPPGIVVDTEAKLGRFASTHFTDGDPIRVWCKVEFDLVAQDDSRTRVALEATIVLAAYNKHLAWANEVGPPAHGGIPSFEGQTTQERGEAVARLAAAELRHGAENGVALLGKEPIEQGLAKATVVFASTHGNGPLSQPPPGWTPAGVGSSFWGPPPWGTYPLDQHLSWAEVQSAVGQGGFREVPAPNMAFLYSCDALAHGAPEDFGWQMPYRNKALVGFSEPVVGQLVPENAEPSVTWEQMYGPDLLNPQPVGHLHQHVSWLFDELKKFGPNHRIASAVAKANQKYPPRGLPTAQGFPLRNIGYAGDGAATLSKVYLHPAEEVYLILQFIVVKSWYVYFP